MRLLVLDGNSILNRAFYGIKILTTKDGRFVNGIYGFLNILIKLREECQPDAVAIAFDMKGPTFRHKMYEGYKAQRKGMPQELAEQMPVLKELLTALGYKLVEKEGWEADDILGTLAKKCEDCYDCVIATGDRDSLQLISENVKVMLASAKMGKAYTTLYDVNKITEEYSVTPNQLIDIKALMGDPSDNIPGVAGIGQKTATDLIARFGSIDYIYENLERLDIKDGVREKLKNGKDMAFLSRTLGTISTEAPIDTEIERYVPSAPSEDALKQLAQLEMFSIIEKLNLNRDQMIPAAEKVDETPLPIEKATDLITLLSELRASEKAFFITKYQNGELMELNFRLDDKIVTVSSMTLGFNEFADALWSDESIKKYTHDIKMLYSNLLRHGIDLKSAGFDTLLAGYILNPSANDYAVLRLAQEYNVHTPKIEQTDETLSSVAVLPALCDKLSAVIEKNGQNKLLYEMEMPLALVLASMENIGFEVDEPGIKNFGLSLEKQISEITSEIFQQVGYEFNLNSPKQLGEALFVKLGLPAKKKTKSGYSTNAEVLESLADEHPVVASVLEYRTLAKLKSTYCDGLLKVIGPDGRIHSTLNQTETRTGRISSTEPNLQNIPIKQPLGRELRRYFKAAEGYLLIDADYSQIELRVLAHIANDEAMIEAFNNNEDIHTITASQVFHMPAEMVTPLMRSRAKAVNFGIVYGIGAFSLAKDIGVSRAEADRYIKGYLEHYSGVREYMKSIVKDAKAAGYVDTIFGRRRYLPELNSSNAMMRAFGERVALNMPIQGTAADIIKLAMIRVYHRLKAEKLKSRLILQVHDELIVEAPVTEAPRAKQILQEEMENAAEMQVRLYADVNEGKTWYDAKG